MKPTEARLEIIRLLQTELAAIQARRKSYSLRRFASQLQIPAPILSEVMRGKRNITRDLARRILSALEAPRARTQQLLAAIPTREPRAAVHSHDNYFVLADDEFRMVSDWWYLAILSLAETHDFDPSPPAIARRLGISREQAHEATETLVRLKMLIPAEEGGLRASGMQFRSSFDIADASIRKHHAQGIELARQALLEVPVELREFSANWLVSDPSLLPEAKEKLRKLRREIVSLLESSPKKSEVYRLSIQLFPVTRSGSQSD